MKNKNALSKEESPKVAEVVEPKEVKKVEEATQQKESPKNKYVEAVVSLDKTHEIRRYSLKNHGKDFMKLAESFSKKFGYTVELLTE